MKREIGAEERFAGLDRYFRRVVVFGEMSKAGPFQMVCVAANEARGLQVGEMTAEAPNSSFYSGGIGAEIEHLDVVVAFDEHGIQGADQLIQLFGDMTEIREDAEPISSV